MICIIDYGLGNVGSILNMCKHIGVHAVISSEKDVIHSASHLLLPGVGAFDSGIRNIKEQKLEEMLTEEVVVKGKPVLGICLGAQLMLGASEEGQLAGLNWIDGKAVRFDGSYGLKIPHMGWNSLTTIYDTALFEGMPETPPRFYFVHSYYFNLVNKENIAAISLYGSEFPSAFRKNNIFGVQFHPEKSHRFGMQLLLNFSSIE
jgi:imidazole glycerol-phosphate synthase subunit HisH